MLIDEIDEVLRTHEYLESITENIDGTVIIEDEFYDKTRWEIWFRAIVSRGDEYVAVVYNTPATEIQESYFEYTLEAVVPVKVFKTIYSKFADVS